MSHELKNAGEPTTEAEWTRIAKNLGVSCLSATAAYIPHHPLYTLKSQMMYYGQDFRFANFFRQTWSTKGLFLMRGTSQASLKLSIQNIMD